MDRVNVTSEADNGHYMSTNEASAASTELRKDPVNSAPEALQSMDAATFTDTIHMYNSLSDIYEVPPFHVLKRVHQSGVNCLHLSHINDSECVSGYCVLSGGDDQALHCLTFTLAMPQTDRASENNNYSGNTNNVMDWGYKLRILSRDSITSSHSSAVKGVWTDGSWSFTTGLDQRVRCWHHDDHGKLTEHGHVVLSVPEPETLDAVACGRNEYQIAVAGRGMQMVKFSASC